MFLRSGFLFKIATAVRRQFAALKVIKPPATSLADQRVRIGLWLRLWCL